jgi:hypothetical protein
MLFHELFIFSLVSRTDLLDDNVLESIETSFKQFHAFLDMLNGAEYVFRAESIFFVNLRLLSVAIS